MPVSGTWEATIEGTGSIQLRVQGQGGRTIPITVSLSKGDYAPLHCAVARGTVTRRPAGGSALPLAAGAAIRIGDTIETGAGSGAIVILGDRSVVMMQDRTRIEVPDIPENQSGTQKVRASSGKVWFAVQKAQQGQKFEVETREAVAAVRGTEFLVELEEDGEDAITTAEGEVEMLDREGRQPPVPVPAGMRWFRRRGEHTGADPAPP
jgi:ferric-dicitrate binding protein FerR (iron transport regulator)